MAFACNPVVHLELHTGDLPGARAFYAQLCGWNAERIHVSAGSYLALDLGRGDVGVILLHQIWTRELGAAVLLEPREGPVGWRSVVAAPASGELAFWQPKR